MRAILFFMFLTSCGSDCVAPFCQERIVERRVEKKVYPQPEPEPVDPTIPAERIPYAKMQEYLNRYCLSCHSTAKFMSSEAKLRGSTTLKELTSRGMPRGSLKLPETIRTQMINFFR